MTPTQDRRAANVERRRNAVALALAGVDYDTIAERLDYTNRAAVQKDIQRALRPLIDGRAAQTPDEQREVDLMRLDRLQASVWPAAITGDLRAIDTVTRIIATRARLLRADAEAHEAVQAATVMEAGISDLTARIAARRTTATN